MSPFDPRILTEWSQLVFPATPLSAEDKEDRWRVLYDSCVAGEDWLVAVPDAGLVSSLGVTLALQAGRFDQAAKLAAAYLKHPDAGDQRDGWDEMRSRLGISKILCGSVDEGVQVLDEVLASGRWPDQLRRLILRSDLHSMLHDLGYQNRPEEQIKAFFSRLLTGWSAWETKAQAAMGANTYAELSTILELTYPRSDAVDSGATTGDAKAP